MTACFEVWGENRIWACIPEFTFLGWDRGCAVGCASCSDEFSVAPHGFAEGDGVAWIRPRNFHESRDGRGLFHFPAAKGAGGHADLDWFACRKAAQYEMAFCHRYTPTFGEEFFARSICDCHFVCGAPSPVPITDPMERCFVTLGERFPATDAPDIVCSGLDTPPIDPDLPTAPLILRFEPRGNAPTTLRPDGPCSMDAAVRCYGQQTNAGCFPSSGNPVHYYNLNGRDAFGYAFVHALGGRFKEWPEFDESQLSRVQAANAVLNWLSDDIAKHFNGLTHLDQIDGGTNQMFAATRRDSNQAFNLNAQLSNWFRGFNLLWDSEGNPVADLPDLPAVKLNGLDIYNQSHLMNSRHAVVAELVVISGYLSMQMVLHSVNDRGAGMFTGPETWRVYPGIRLQLHLELAMRMSFPDGDPRQLIQTWRGVGDPFHTTTITVGNDGFATNFNTLVQPAGPSGAPIDRIVFRDQLGRVSVPPRMIDVEYHLGPMSVPAWTNVLDQNVDDTTCCQIARGMDSVTVPVLASNFDQAGNEKQKLQGSARIGMPWQGICS